MRNAILKLSLQFQGLRNEEGQDLVEYALLCSLIALTLIAGISNIATAVNLAFTHVSTSLA